MVDMVGLGRVPKHPLTDHLLSNMGAVSSGATAIVPQGEGAMQIYH